MTSSGTATPTGRQPTKWWADGDEPIYYVVSPKVERTLTQLSAGFLACTASLLDDGEQALC